MGGCVFVLGEKARNRNLLKIYNKKSKTRRTEMKKEIKRRQGRII